MGRVGGGPTAFFRLGISGLSGCCSRSAGLRAGRWCGKSWGGSSRQIYFGSVCFGCLPFPSQWLVKRGKVNLYPGDRLASLSRGNFLNSASWGLEAGRGQARKEGLSRAVFTSFIQGLC